MITVLFLHVLHFLQHTLLYFEGGMKVSHLPMGGFIGVRRPLPRAFDDLVDLAKKPERVKQADDGIRF